MAGKVFAAPTTAATASFFAKSFASFDVGKLLGGKINLFLDPNGVGEKHELSKGAIFGEKHFRCLSEANREEINLTDS